MAIVEMLDADLPDYLRLHDMHAGGKGVAIFEILRGAISKTAANECDIGGLLDGDMREELRVLLDEGLLRVVVVVAHGSISKNDYNSIHPTQHHMPQHPTASRVSSTEIIIKIMGFRRESTCPRRSSFRS